MAKARNKSSCKSRNTEPDAKDGVGPPPQDPIGVTFALSAQSLTAGTAQPGDSPAEAAARQYLIHLMTTEPIPAKRKDALVRECCVRFGLTKRTAESLREWAIRYSGAIAYKKSGPR